VQTVYADGTHIKNPAAVAAVAAPFLEMLPGVLTQKLTTERPYLVIKKGVVEEKARGMINAMDKAGLHGLYLQEEQKGAIPMRRCSVMCSALSIIPGMELMASRRCLMMILLGRMAFG